MARTFTVLFQDNDEEYGFTDEQAIQQLRRGLQAGMDDGDLGGNFLILSVEDGDAGFWNEWKARLPKAEANG